MWDHLCQNYNSSKDNYVTSIVQHPELLNINYQTQKDWIHMNGIDYNAELDQIVVSSHNLNEIYVIDHSTTTTEAAGHTGGNAGRGGDFLYRWGNPAAYGASGTKIFNVVHDAHWVPNDCPNAGYLVAFNNKGGSGGKSAIDMINPPLDGYNYSITLGNAFTPSSYFWRYTSSYSTNNTGNSQQLPNGNMQMCCPSGSVTYLIEISSSGTILWSKSITGGIPQAFRYSADYVNNTPPPTNIDYQDDNFDFFPNPTSGIINFNRNSTNIESLNIAVYNYLGVVVKTLECTNSIDISDLNNGVYFLKLKTSSDKNIIKRIVLNK